jgi:tetratricopeptide (TPR) repeat protein
MQSDTERALYTLRDARLLWKALNWPIEHLKMIVYTLKNYMECLLEVDEPTEEASVHSDLLMLHSVLIKLHNDMLIADVFTCLGMVAFNNEREHKAVVFFEQACALHKQTKGIERSSEEIMKLLRFIGVASYNCLDFTKAANAYLECLHLLETQQSMEVNKTSHVAECCASLGFTFSRLRDFDNMLNYYERAFALENRLSSEDLELIITNIGSLFHVKAVKLEQDGLAEMSHKYYEQADAAFHKALRYSWKSFPFINFGYYLLCQGKFFEASSILQQGYLNGVIDKDTVEFDHTEDPILIEDLRHELTGIEFIRIPSTIISLYLKSLAQVKMGDVISAETTAEHLEHEVKTCQYGQYYSDGYGQDRMEALCKSLVGYVFRALGNQAKATQAFHGALDMVPQYEACKRNLELQSMFQCDV